MSEAKKIDVNSLYSVLLREVENDSVQELDPELYASISEYVGKLKSEGYDGIENKIKNKIVEMATQVTQFS